MTGRSWTTAPPSTTRRDSLTCLSVSKAYSASGTRTATAGAGAAVEAAPIAPRGPVSLEIRSTCSARWRSRRPRARGRSPHAAPPDPALLDVVARLAVQAKRPLLWLGGGARGGRAGDRPGAALRGRHQRQRTCGVPKVTRAASARSTWCGSGGDHRNCDLMIVGLRLRGNETKNNQMVRRAAVQIDADLTRGRNYPVDLCLRRCAACARGLAPAAAIAGGRQELAMMSRSRDRVRARCAQARPLPGRGRCAVASVANGEHPVRRRWRTHVRQPLRPDRRPHPGLRRRRHWPGRRHGDRGRARRRRGRPLRSLGWRAMVNCRNLTAGGEG